MKRIIPVFIVLILIAGCNQKNNKVEIIKLNDNNYLAGHEIDNGQEVFSGNYSTDLYNEIDQKVKEQGYKDVEFENYDLTLFINESGKLDKIIVMNAPNDKIANIITSILAEQTYKIAKKDGKPVKYRFEWSYSSVYKVAVEQMPVPIGGIAAIQKNIVYPERARRAGIQGKVYVQTFINEAGDVARTNILKGIGAGCDEAAENAIKETKFKPGLQRGIPVKVQVTVPVVFKLSDKK